MKIYNIQIGVHIPYILKEKHYNIWGSNMSSPQSFLESLEKYVDLSEYLINFLLN